MELQVQRIDTSIPLPQSFHEHDAGIDLPSRIDAKIKPNERAVIQTGIRMAIPKGHVGLIWDRSGLAAKHGLHTLAGVIDAGYRGEIGVAIMNLSDKEFVVEKGMRIAQILIQPVANPTVVEVASFDNTSRGEGGFGSTDKR